MFEENCECEAESITITLFCKIGLSLSTTNALQNHQKNVFTKLFTHIQLYFGALICQECKDGEVFPNQREQVRNYLVMNLY